MNRKIQQALCVGLALALAACSRNEFVPPPPPEVTVAKPVMQPVTDYMYFTGTTAATEYVELRARVKGFVQTIQFTPGKQVSAGDVLVTIDAAPFEAAVKQAQGEAAAARAKLQLAQIEYERFATLLKTAATSQKDVDIRKAQRDQAQGQLDMALASLDQAQLDLSYTKVTSPVNGMVGMNRVDVGALVGVTDPTLLTTVANDKQVYVYFNLTEADYLVLRRRQAGKGALEMDLAVADDPNYSRVGRFDTGDNTLDPNTGTMRLRAVFPNDDSLLRAGMFVRLRVAMAKKEGLTVPESAVGQDQVGHYVYVLGADNKVERRTVRKGPSFDQRVRIDEGLKADETIIVNGLLRARPGHAVSPKSATGK